MKSNLVKSFISDLNPYSGEYNDLSRFLTDVEDIIEPLSELDPLETLIRFRQITQKLRGKARRILQERPETWEAVKRLLIRECADQMDIGTQILAMERVTYQGSIYRTYEKIMDWQTRMLDKIDLSQDPHGERQILRDSVRRRCYMHLRKSLPQACQGALTSRLCTNISDAITILHEEDFLNYDRFYQDRKAPVRQFHPNPMNPVRTQNMTNYRQNNNANYRNQNANLRTNNLRNNQQLENRNRNPTAGPSNPTQGPRASQNRPNERRETNYRNERGNNPPQRKQKPWKFHRDNFDEPVQYNAAGDVEPMDYENFYLTPQQQPEELLKSRQNSVTT